MKSMFARIGLLALVAALALGSGACKKQEEKKDTTAEQPAVTDAKQPVEPDAKQPAAPGAKPPGGPAANQPARQPGGEPAVEISSEDYWNIQLARLEDTKQLYTDILAVYEKYDGDSPEAQQEVRALRQANQEKMREIFTEHGMASGRDFFPRGPNRREVMQQRQQYLKNNTEMWENYQAMNKEIRDLRQKVREYTGGPERGPRGMMRPGSGGQAPVPPPPAPGNDAPATDRPADQ